MYSGLSFTEYIKQMKANLEENKANKDQAHKSKTLSVDACNPCSSREIFFVQQTLRGGKVNNVQPPSPTLHMEVDVPPSPALPTELVAGVRRGGRNSFPGCTRFS